jgi:hypothetical protein
MPDLFKTFPIGGQDLGARFAPRLAKPRVEIHTPCGAVPILGVRNPFK